MTDDARPMCFSKIRPCAAMLTLAACLLLPGCGKSPTEQALDDASILLETLDLGVGVRSAEPYAVSAYNDVIAKLSAVQGSADEQERGDIAVLMSQAQRGLAQPLLARARALDRGALDAAEPIRAELRAWVTHHARAEAAAAYDPTAELARIDAEVKARQEEVAKEQAKKNELDSRIGALLTQIAEKLAASSAHRNRAGEFTLRIAQVSATEGLTLAEQAREATRAADALDLEASTLRAQTDRLAPDASEAQVMIDKLLRQIEAATQARAGVRARAGAAEAEAAEARADAQQAAQRIATAIDSDQGATPARTLIGEAYEQGAAAFTKAAGTARGGISTARANAQLALGQALQSVGDAHWSHAHGLAAYADLMRSLAQATPALPASAEYAQRAGTAAESANAARAEARQAYQDAKSAFESAGARGDARAMVEQVARRLDLMSREAGGETIDPAEYDRLMSARDETGEESTEPAEETGEDPAAPEDSVSSLRQAISETLGAIAAQDPSKAMDFIEPATDADAAVVAAMGPVIEAQFALDAATKEAFGESFSTWSSENAQNQGGLGSGMTGSFSPEDLASIDVGTLDIRADGDEGVVLTGNADLPQLEFRRVDGRWKLVFSLDALMPAGAAGGISSEQARSLMIATFTPTADVMNEAVEGVRSGSLQSNQAVMVTIQTKLTPIMMKIMQDLQQGGGGG